MVLTDVFRITADEDSGNFDPSEADDLKLHVRQCGRRYRALDGKVTLVARLVLLLILLDLASKFPGLISVAAKIFATTP